MMNVEATTVGMNKCALMALPNNKPNSTAGKKAINTLTANRRAILCEGKAITVLLIFSQNTNTTANMAPVWIKSPYEGGLSKLGAVRGISAFEPEPHTGRWLAYTVDTIGDERYVLMLLDIDAPLQSAVVADAG